MHVGRIIDQQILIFKEDFPIFFRFFRKPLDFSGEVFHSFKLIVQLTIYFQRHMTAQALEKEKREFQAEVKQLLDIVIHSLYTDKEIFIRELISNASDALEKVRHMQLTTQEIFEGELPLEVNVVTDEAAGTITIEDNGIGMTREELIENLGTIAHSGSKSFLEALKESGGSNENLIGQFGVGFYSAFMVAERVDVYTHSWRKDVGGYCWSSEGAGDYTIEEASGCHRGCKVVVKLKEEYKEFSKKEVVKGILKRYSNFLQFPLNLDGERTNKVEALWIRNKNEIKDEEYKEFYKFQANAFDEPSSWLHFSADAPLEINALLFVPSENVERLGFGRMEPQVALYCRKVLIDGEPKGLFPEWLRFLRGVVDSSDLPLNISRQTMQDSALIQKLNRVLTKRFLKHLEDLAAKKPEEYGKFWKNFGFFIKEGVAIDYSHREQLAKLLRFESSFAGKEELVSLQDYVGRMKDTQQSIYYLTGLDRLSLEESPYLEAFKLRGIEVLFLYEPIDDFVMAHLGEFEGKKLIAGEQGGIDFEDTPVPEEGESALDADSIKDFCEWMKEVLGSERVEDVLAGKRLTKGPVLALQVDKMNSSMRRMLRAMKPEEPMVIKVNLEINPRHSLIKALYELKKVDLDRAKMIAKQLLDNALMAAGLLENPRGVVERMYDILEIAAKK